ncbi:uncharacterized protein BYT42DRAFT_545151 [Radiomyces spectabilis]|uniref:uncharacterized protein n=1 Tax=Radiomyces spectabilis TaxID=64574 RepID=UPI00221E9578|nr:uncharacterized protein BYT42DRAFT_545151 [Radiomyces spectabilis]KAI8381224.1 hypothetical protein BYT42DRAFT_545151 [Radiomyces spectabilis]
MNERADRLSRLLALQPEFIDLVTAALVDSTAGTYNAAANFLFTECDAIYLTRLANLPPIILEFQTKVGPELSSSCLLLLYGSLQKIFVLVIRTSHFERFCW